MVRTEKKIFIPFLEGTLNYDCQECGYNCCQSGLIIMNTREKRMLVEKYPSLRYFLLRKTRKRYEVKKFERCWFLKDNGLCCIHEKYRYSSKPFICRLHPFYVSRCRDEYIVRPRLCRNLHVDRESKNISHKQILRNAREAIDLPYIMGQINWSVKRLKLEKKILEKSKGFLNNSNYVDFLACQIALTRGTTNTSVIKQGLLERLELWKSFLGIRGLRIKNRKLTYELTVLTPLLRAEISQLTYVDESKMPLRLLALYLYMILFLKVNKVRTYVDTYKEMLEDMPIGLILLENKDLSLRNSSTETKLEYLRLLRRISSNLQS